MFRREIRLRKEYLYRKNKQAQENATNERKSILRNALENGKQIPTELLNEEEQFRKDLEYEDDYLLDEQDDEYRYAGVDDPKVVITTSHEPSSKLQQFAKEIRLIFPNAQKINRGSYDTKQLVTACKTNGITDLIILHETRGQPDTMIISHLPFGPTISFSIYNVVMRHDLKSIDPMSESYPHLIFHNFTTGLGKRINQILKHLFPVPKVDSKRVMSFININDFISFRHHVYNKNRNDPKQVDMQEVGPRFEMRPYEIKLGTIEQNEADIEWHYRPFMNTAKKRKYIGNAEIVEN